MTVDVRAAIEQTLWRLGYFADRHLTDALVAVVVQAQADAWVEGRKYGESTALGHAVPNLVMPGTTPYDRADALTPTKETK